MKSPNDPPRISHEHLNMLALAYGLKRRWRGWEPDWMLRRRMSKIMKKGTFQ